MDNFLSLWKKILIRDPELAVRTTRDFFAEAELTPEERLEIEKVSEEEGAFLGKFAKHRYGDTIDQLAENEHQRSLQKNKEVVDAYDKDVEGSYQAAKEKASREGLFSESDERDNFINRARAVAYVEFEQQRNKELESLSKRYNIGKNNIRSDIIDVLDLPVSVTSAIGRDIGNLAGEVQNEYSAGISSVFGKGSDLSKLVDNTTRIPTAIFKDIKKIREESPWISKKLRRAGDKVQTIEDINPFLGGLHRVHTSWIRQILNDLAKVLDEWYHDPRTLCCFIKNIAAWATSSSGRMLEEQKKYFSGEIEWTALTNTRNFFDRLIVILKVIREFLKQDIGFHLMLNIDLGLMMSKASLGAVCGFLMALQQMLEETVYGELLKIVERNINEEWRQCFPFERLLRILSDFITGPDGLFKYIEQYVDALLNSFSANMNTGFNEATKSRMIDVTAIDKIIHLIEAIRDSVLNLEMCIEADFSQTDQKYDDANRSEGRVGYGDRNYSDLTNKIHETGRDYDNQTGKFRGVVFPTDSEVKAFIKNRLGESEAFADQVISTAKKTSDISGLAAGSSKDQGDNASNFKEQIERAIGDCSRTLDPNKIEEMADLMAKWEINL